MGFAVVAMVALLLVIILYITADFSYHFEGDYLLMKWRILKYLPFRTFKLRLIDIMDVRRSSPDDVFWSLVVGNIFLVHKGVTFLLKRTFYAGIAVFTKKIVITPRNPDEFIEEITSKLSGMDTGLRKE